MDIIIKVNNQSNGRDKLARYGCYIILFIPRILKKAIPLESTCIYSKSVYLNIRHIIIYNIPMLPYI